MSNIRASGRPPRSIQEIAETSANFVYDPSIPFKNWLRAARSLRQQAEIYEAEGDLERAYELYFRQVILALEYLPKHPEAKVGGNRQLFGVAGKDAQISLTRCEAIKPYIKTAYDDYERRRRTRESEAVQRRAEAGPVRSSTGSVQGPIRLSGDYTGSRYEEYSGQHHQDVALEVSRRGQRPSGRAKQSSLHANDDESLSQQMQGVRLRMEGKSLPQKRQSNGSNTLPPSLSSWAYPDVPASKPAGSGSQHELWLAGLDQAKSRQGLGAALPEQLSIRSPPMGPVIPRKEPLQDSYTPARPPKESSAPGIQSTTSFAKAPELPPKSAPAPAIEAKVFKPAAYLENGTPLRTVFFPPQMRIDFLRLAQSNTSRNLETCGILCGTLKSNALFIEKLVIPEQESTSDTCEMTVEGEIKLFDYCDGQDLLTLGWIHTHPTQTCFMSSRDLHTHCGYQAMVPESVAIVCAPSLNEWGAFRLTDPPGMKTIQACKKPGLFHPHEVDRIYTEAIRPGHVVQLDGLAYSTEDMRLK